MSRAELSAAPFIPNPAISFHAIAGIGVYEYVALKDYIAGLFGGRVDVVSRDDRRPILGNPAQPLASVACRRDARAGRSESVAGGTLH